MLANVVRNVLMFLAVIFGVSGLWGLLVAYRKLGWWVD
jgi:hypothetical protein